MDTQQNSPLTPNTSAIDPNGHKKVGPIIATLVIVLILIIAALYVFASRLNQQAVPTDESTAPTVDNNYATTTSTQVQPVSSKADDVKSLQADLNVSTYGVDSQNF